MFDFSVVSYLLFFQEERLNENNRRHKKLRSNQTQNHDIDKIKNN